MDNLLVYFGLAMAVIGYPFNAIRDPIKNALGEKTGLYVWYGIVIAAYWLTIRWLFFRKR